MEKKISHSEISTYLTCQKQWDLTYNKKIKLSNIDFEFGKFAHSVMETRIIPLEILNSEFKEHYGIRDWHFYFTTIFKTIDNEFFNYEIFSKEEPVENDAIKGIIDLVLKSKIDGHYIIADYKFTKNAKTLRDLNDDEQLYIYTLLFALKHGVKLEDIEICYISIPKQNIDAPRLLSNGSLSKDKAQATTYALYYEEIKNRNLNVEDYEEILDYFKSKPLIEIVKTSPNPIKLTKIIDNINNVIKDMRKGYILEKNGYDCSRCKYFDICKKD